jgi:hypothetical protein
MAMTDTIPAASQDEIAVFLKAAEDTYAASGISPEHAAPMFEQQLDKIASDLQQQGYLFPQPAEVGNSNLKQGGASSDFQANDNSTPSQIDKQAEESNIIFKAAMDYFFEQGTPKAEANTILRAGVDRLLKQAKGGLSPHEMVHASGRYATPEEKSAYKKKKDKKKSKGKYTAKKAEDNKARVFANRVIEHLAQS